MTQFLKQILSTNFNFIKKIALNGKVYQKFQRMIKKYLIFNKKYFDKNPSYNLQKD